MRRAPLLDVRDVTKAFPGLKALDAVSLEVRSGEVVAIIGHNGSGKSTLVKILAGVYTHDAGTVALAERDGVATELHFIHQDLGLIDELNTVENLELARGWGRGALAVNRTRRQRSHARRLLERFGGGIDVDLPVGRLTPAQKAVVAIARALDGWTHPHNVLVLDEPTEALAAADVKRLFDAVRTLAREGAGVLFISHRLEEVSALADRVVVLRDGRKVADRPGEELDHAALARLLTGAAVSEDGRRVSTVARTTPVLRVRGLTAGALRDVDLDLHAGEVVGVAGVLGSGREDLPAALFGSIPAVAGELRVRDRVLEPGRPEVSIRAGVALVPGDRVRYGATGPMTARENLMLMRPPRDRLGAVDTRRERAQTVGLMEDFDVRPARSEQQFSLFSGGNQQKIVLAKWLRNAPSVLLLDEPTQGVDVGAKVSIYAAIDRAVGQGTAVLVASSDDRELLRLCDRVLVLRGGKVIVELEGAALTADRLVRSAHALSGGQDER